MSVHQKRRRLIIAATGASGSPLLLECLRMVKAHPDWESCLVMSRGAKLTLGYETDLAVEDVYRMADTVLEPEDIDAAPASGSFSTAGMLVVPCSMKTVAGIASGYADTLILRAADVTIKEQRLCHFIDSEEYGLYHVVCPGSCSRYEFARTILEYTGKTGDLDLYPVVARDDVRPTYSVLDNMMLRLTGIPEPLDWKTALDRKSTRLNSSHVKRSRMPSSA